MPPLLTTRLPNGPSRFEASSRPLERPVTNSLCPSRNPRNPSAKLKCCQSVCLSGQYRIRGNAVVCNVIRQTSHEPNNSHLGSDVVAHARNGQAHHIRRYADDAAPLFRSHRGQEILCTQEMGIKVCSNGFSPRQEIELVNRAVGEITCIVDNNIHLTQFLAFSGY